MANFCPLVWIILNARWLKKFDKLKNRAIRLLSNDYELSYEELFSKSATSSMITSATSSMITFATSSMNVKRLNALCFELYKTTNELNSMKFLNYILQTDPFVKNVK